MNKLSMHTPNLVDENIRKLAELFPNALTERKNEKGEVERAIDFDVLRQELSHMLVEGREERYQFTWPDKRQAMLLANAPISDTLRPCREESVDYDTTQNLYIEGDNLQVLKLLRETYLGKVKMIYIDPPYNTGNDFVYEDDYALESNSYKQHSGQYDEEGNRLFRNMDTNGRFHTDWLNMMYPRLRLAKDLLTEDGVIFVSIDDNEVANLRKQCDEVFGEHNFIAQVIWERAYAPINLMKHFSNAHDYIVVYSKSIDLAVCNGIKRSDEADGRYSNPDDDPRGVWKSSDMSVGPAVASNIYRVKTPSGRFVEPPAGRSWRLSENAFSERLQDNRIWFGSDGNAVPSIKRFRSELRKEGITPMTIWKYAEVGHSQSATKALKELFDNNMYFDYPKPVPLIERVIQLYSEDDSIILDFFSGSATTAHAVMQLNAEDGGKRKFIMVQLPEETDPKSEAYKAGYRNICEIGKERIRRAGNKITEELNKQNQQVKLGEEAKPLPDTGFRVLKLASSNMKDVYYSPEETTQLRLLDLAENIKEDRTAEDLLFQVMLDLGVLPSSDIKKQTIGGKTVYSVAEGFLMACFDSNITEDTITHIAKLRPHYAVFRDSGYANDSVAVNFEQIFKAYSPDTVRRVL